MDLDCHPLYPIFTFEHYGISKEWVALSELEGSLFLSPGETVASTVGEELLSMPINNVTT
jgi:hypothetical protein